MELVDDNTIVRGMVRVQSGEGLIDVVRALATTAGWVEALVTGAGVFDLVELERAEGAATYETAEILSLSGRVVRRPEGLDVTLRAMVLVDGRVEAGRILAAMTGGMTLLVDAVAAPSAARAPGKGSGSVRAPEPVVPAVTPSSPRRIPSAAPSTPARPPLKPLAPPRRGPGGDGPEEHENPIIDDGDVLNHPQLGRLLVVGDDASGGVKVRVDGGKIKVLRLDALHIETEPVIEADGTRCFTIAGPRVKRSRY
ncbi:MAG: hypothetical protein AAF928_06195 [Myxococcota bacterium]